MNTLKNVQKSCFPERVLWLNFIIFCTVWCIKQNKNADRKVKYAVYWLDLITLSLTLLLGKIHNITKSLWTDSHYRSQRRSLDNSALRKKLSII